MSGNAIPRLVVPRNSTHEANKCFAVKVRSRAEIKVSHQLRAKGYKVVVPSYIVCRKYSDRIKELVSVLFPGYLFVWLNVKELLPLLSTPGVDYVVKSGSMLYPLSVEEIAVVEALALMREECQPCDRMRVGQRVRIETGPLRGQQGLLVRNGNSDRVVISIDSISSAVSVTLDGIIITVV